MTYPLSLSEFFISKLLATKNEYLIQNFAKSRIETLEALNSLFMDSLKKAFKAEENIDLLLFFLNNEEMKSLLSLNSPAFQNDINCLVIQNCDQDSGTIILDLILNAGYDPNAKNAEGYSLLAMAIFFKKYNVLKKLLAHPLIQMNQFLPEGYPPLYLAFIKEDKQAFKELIDAGANPNFAYKNLSFLLLLIGTKNTPILKILLTSPLVDLNCSFREVRPLFLAAEVNDFEALQLLHQYGANLEETVNSCTLLYQAVYYNCSREFIEYIIRNDANFVAESSNLSYSGALKCAVSKRNIDLIDFFMQGVDPFTILWLLKFKISTENNELFEIFFKNFPQVIKLIKFINEEDIESTKEFLKIHALGMTQKEIHFLILLCINNIKFNFANIFSEAYIKHEHFEKEELVRFSPKFDGKSPRMMIDSSDWIFPVTIGVERRAAIIDACQQIVSLLDNPSHCINLLMKLESAILCAQEQLGVDFSQVKPGQTFLIRGQERPSAPDPSKPFFNSKSLLRNLLRAILSPYGIDTKELAVFAGFIAREVADEHVLKGGLFTEHFLLGDFNHGKYPHYIQIVLIVLGLEEGFLYFEDGLTPLELLKALIEVRVDNLTIWDLIIDSTTTHFTFRCPQYLTSYLLTNPILPHLRGCLLNSWHKGIHKLRLILKEVHGQTLDYTSIVLGKIIAGEYIDKFDPGLSYEQVEQYHMGRFSLKPKTSGILNSNTKVLFKKPIPTFLLTHYGNLKVDKIGFLYDVSLFDGNLDVGAVGKYSKITVSAGEIAYLNPEQCKIRAKQQRSSPGVISGLFIGTNPILCPIGASIEGRLYSDGVIKISSLISGNYCITPPVHQKMAIAEFDNQLYAGPCIRIENNKVIEGQRVYMGQNPITEDSTSFGIRVRGSIDDNVTLIAPGDITIEDNVGKNCKIISQNGKVSIKGKIGANCHIEDKKEVSCNSPLIVQHSIFKPSTEEPHEKSLSLTM